MDDISNETQAAEALRPLFDLINRGPGMTTALADEAIWQHRTLQQGFTRFVVAYLATQADNYESGTYDLRNHATCEWAKQLADAGLLLPPKGLPYI